MICLSWFDTKQMLFISETILVIEFLHENTSVTRVRLSLSLSYTYIYTYSLLFSSLTYTYIYSISNNRDSCQMYACIIFQYVEIFNEQKQKFKLISCLVVALPLFLSLFLILFLEHFIRRLFRFLLFLGKIVIDSNFLFRLIFRFSPYRPRFTLLVIIIIVIFSFLD